ncbi:hypothetical protein [Burkholderia sp. PU8-34]
MNTMVTGPILDQINQILHQELAKKSRRPAAGGLAGLTITGQSKQQNHRSADPHAVLRSRIGRLIASGTNDTPVLIRAAVEFLLQREFGDQLASTASFQEMTDFVTRALLEDSQSKAAAIEMVGR